MFKLTYLFINMLCRALVDIGRSDDNIKLFWNLSCRSRNDICQKEISKRIVTILNCEVAKVKKAAAC